MYRYTIYLSIYLSIHLSIHLSFFLSIDLFINNSIYLNIYRSTAPPQVLFLWGWGLSTLGLGVRCSHLPTLSCRGTETPWRVLKSCTWIRGSFWSGHGPLKCREAAWERCMLCISPETGHEPQSVPLSPEQLEQTVAQLVLCISLFLFMVEFLSWFNPFHGQILSMNVQVRGRSCAGPENLRGQNRPETRRVLLLPSTPPSFPLVTSKTLNPEP